MTRSWLDFGILVETLYALLLRIAPKMVSTTVFILLVRHQDSGTAGIFSLSTAFCTFGVLLSSLGLDELIVRELAQEPTLTRKYLINMLFLRGIFSLIGYGMIVVLVVWLLDYSQDVSRFILIQGLVLFPESLRAVIIAVFNAMHKLGWAALVAGSMSSIQMLLAGLYFWSGTSIEMLALGMVVGSCLGLLLALLFVFQVISEDGNLFHGRVGVRLKRPLLDLRFSRRQLVRALPFALVLALVSFDSQLDVILLSRLRDISEVAIYSAARNMVLLFSLLPQSLRMVIYPRMSKAYSSSSEQLTVVYRRAWQYLSVIGFPVVLGGIAVAPALIKVVYDDMPPATDLSLQILMGHLLVGFLYLPSTRLMIVSDHQIQLSWFLAGEVVINIILNLFLVPKLGSVGTSLARAITSFIYFATVEIFVVRHLMFSHRGVTHTIKALIAAIVMLVIVSALPYHALYLRVSFGVVVYSLMLLLLEKNLRRHVFLRGLDVGSVLKDEEENSSTSFPME